MRIAVEVLLPPAIAALIFLALFAAEGPIRAKTVGLLFVFAYAYAIIPSIAYAAVMELAFARGLRPSTLRAVLFSSALGLLSGVAIGLVFPEPSAAKSVLPMAVIGFVAGTVTGLAIGALPRSNKKMPNKAPEPTPGVVTPRATEGGSK